jgi:hypothetical protein
MQLTNEERHALKVARIIDWAFVVALAFFALALFLGAPAMVRDVISQIKSVWAP